MNHTKKPRRDQALRAEKSNRLHLANGFRMLDREDLAAQQEQRIEEIERELAALAAKDE